MISMIDYPLLIILAFVTVAMIIIEDYILAKYISEGPDSGFDGV